MLRRLRGCVYGTVLFAPAAGTVARLLGFCASEAAAAASSSKVNTWAPLWSGGWADRGGVAVMAVLGRQISRATAGDAGCAVMGVSRYGPR